MRNPGFVKRAFKLKFGLNFCILTVAGMSAATFFIYLMTARSLGDSYGSAIYAIYDLKIRIFPLIFASFYSIFILALITGAIALISLFFTHKIAGPIFRIERNLDVISGGNLTVGTKFRGNDQLEALADDINEMARSLNHKVRSSRDALAEIERCEERLYALAKDDSSSEDDISKALKELKAGIDGLKKTASGIKVI